MFIQDSVSRIMRRSPFGSSTWRWTHRRVTQLKTKRDSTRRATRQVVRRTTYEVVRGHLGRSEGEDDELEGDAYRILEAALQAFVADGEP
jgi:hypothetical protein